MKTVVGLYDRRDNARETIEDLVDAGFSRDRISMATQHTTSQDVKGKESGNKAGEGALAGGTTGAVLGGLGGLLIGLGTLAIPGLGIIAAAGPLAGLLTGALAGGVVGGLVGALIGLGIPEEEAEAYAEGIRRGGTLVVVQSEEDRVDEARSIMERHEPVDVERRSERWRTEGWTGYGTEAELYSEEQIRRGRETAGQAIEPQVVERDVVEEDVHVGKRTLEQGGVRVRSYVVKKPVEEQVLLHDEHIDVERVDLAQESTDREFQFDFGDEGEEVIEFLESEEEVVIEKRPHVVGQVRIVKDVDTETRVVHETARRREVDVERIGEFDEGEDIESLETPKRQHVMSDEVDFQKYEKEFHRHYQRNLADHGRDFAYYRPAYIYGCRLAHREEGLQHTWNHVETEARRLWLEVNPNTSWAEVSGAVRESYDRCQQSGT